MINAAIRDKAAIRDVIENWVLWRDSGDWEAFAGVWHSDGVMIATWQQSRAQDFIAACKAGWENGVDVFHALGGSAIELAGRRAIAQTRMTINQRATVHDERVDVTCMGRFYDFFEQRDERWAIVLRQPIYERDRIDPVDPSARLTLDDTLLARFPAGYRHLAYLQTLQGMNVKTDLPGTRGAGVEQLYADGAAWLRDGRLPPATGPR
ncbi:nuclear transport factor 2 family protein [uncultured Sphingomonas sp.]|uniref:nuclear transport factor 2 family protein n=1 Tax=uncultured Sphingomonas sp. TaxID=158754 RepID=UPI0035CC2C6B